MAQVVTAFRSKVELLEDLFKQYKEHENKHQFVEDCLAGALKVLDEFEELVHGEGVGITQHSADSPVVVVSLLEVAVECIPMFRRTCRRLHRQNPDFSEALERVEELQGFFSAELEQVKYLIGAQPQPSSQESAP